MAQKSRTEKSRLKEGGRVAHKFRGDSWQSTAEVIRVRETKEKTDAGDSVTTIHYDVLECKTTTTAQSLPGESEAGTYVGKVRTQRAPKRMYMSSACVSPVATRLQCAVLVEIVFQHFHFPKQCSLVVYILVRFHVH